MRLKLVIAYDGTSFAGWQSQANGGAVQDKIEASLERIAGSRLVLHGAGRTDSGVHALAQCAHVDVPDGTLAPAGWLRALNATLPAAIRIMQARQVTEDFHARFSAQGKVYRYFIRNAPILAPHEVDRVWHVPHELDVDLLRSAVGLFEGRHDFAAFSANRGGTVQDTHRAIRRAVVTRKGTLLALTFEGEGFLYKMVRMLTGVAVRVAQGREPLESVRQRLSDGAPRWNHVAPAAGLFLAKVIY